MGDFADNMTVSEDAAEMGVTRGRVDRFIREGKLTVAATAGGLRWLSREAVAEFKASRKTTPGPEAGGKKRKK